MQKAIAKMMAKLGSRSTSLLYYVLTVSILGDLESALGQEGEHIIHGSYFHTVVCMVYKVYMLS